MKGVAAYWGRKRDDVDIWRLCMGIMIIRLDIGFAAASVPFCMDATILWILGDCRDVVRGVREEANDCGRSAKNSGREGEDWGEVNSAYSNDGIKYAPSTLGTARILIESAASDEPAELLAAAYVTAAFLAINVREPAREQPVSSTSRATAQW